MSPHCWVGDRGVQPEVGIWGGKADCESVLGDICVPFVELLKAVQPSAAAEDKSGCVVTTSGVGQ